MFKRVLLGVLAAAVCYVLYVWISFPDVSRLATEPPRTTAFMDERRDELRRAGKDDHIDYRWVPYGAISPYLRRAVLVGEDDTFYEHGGVDVDAMRDALQRDWKRRKITHGGSTITQQLAKNLYLSPSRNPIRKVREYFLARSLEDHLTKKRILELYLNVVEMGERIYGAEAASRAYFGVGASGLTPSQAALLAGCLPNPRIMSPAAPNRRLRGRQRMILSRMKRWGYLVEETALVEKTNAPEPPKEPEPAAADTGTTATTETTATTDTSATETVPPPPT